MLSCKKKPTLWNTDLSAPIINDTIDLTHFYTDSTFVNDGTGNLELDFSKTLIDIGLSDIVSIPDTEVVQVFQPSLTMTVPPGLDIFNTVDEHFINIPDVQLKKIRVYKGDIQIKVYNPLNTLVFFDVFLPGVAKDGIPFHESFTVGAGTNTNPNSVTEILKVDGYEMDLKGSQGIAYNTLQSQVIVKTDPAGPSVVVGPSNIFTVEAKLSNISVDYARGYFGQQVLSDTTTIDLPYLNNIVSGAIDLNSISIDVNVYNGMKIPLKSNISYIQNTNNSGNIVNLQSNEIGQDMIINPATGSWNSIQPGTQQFQFNSGNSNIEPFIENLGSQMKVGYSVMLNPMGNINAGWDEIFSTSRVKVSIHAQMPLQLQSDQLTLLDTFTVNLKQDTEKTHITGGSFCLSVSNAFPIQSQAKLSFMDENYMIIEEIIGDALIQSSLQGSINSNGMWVKNSTINFNITPLLITELNRVKYIKIEAILDTPDNSGSANQMVSIPYGAFLHVRLKALLKTQMMY